MRILRTLAVLALMLSLGPAAPAARTPLDRVRVYTRPLEFDFVGWTLQAAAHKFAHAGLNAAAFLEEADRRALALEYAALVERAARLEAEAVEALADPHAADPTSAAAPAQQELRRVRARMAALAPLVEAVLEQQVAVALAEIGMAPAGAPFPPVSFRFSRLPVALVVSPRHVIRQDAQVQLEPDLDLEGRIALEHTVEAALNVSALVVPVGGIGTYPTMVMDSSALAWLADVVAHEWVHNYLTLRPLGWRYDATPELRTMNETAATLIGQAVGQRVIAREYPALAPPPPAEPPVTPETPPETAPPGFDFRAEMHATRVRADALLAEGLIVQAEAYLEARRQVFWDNGYRLRRLNQAYFAFHGAYADQPSGPAGEDPVGAAVRRLWELSGSPADFLRRIAWMTSPADLDRALETLTASP